MVDGPITNGLSAMHPGELLREDVMPAVGRTRADIARLLGVSRQTLHAILTERTPVTPEMALRLGKLCGNGPDLWLALQSRFDLERLSKATRSESTRFRPCWPNSERSLAGSRPSPGWRVTDITNFGSEH